MAEAILQGIAVSSGVAMGSCFYLNRRLARPDRFFISPGEVAAEVERVKRSIEAVSCSFKEARTKIPEHLPDHKEIIDSHLLICKDPKLLEEIERHISQEYMNAEWALEESVEIIAAIFRKIGADYIRERIQDVRLVAEKILRHLMGVEENLREIEGIMLAYDIGPADILEVDTSELLAFVTEQGGSTAHTGIVARGLRIPAVVGVVGLENIVKPGQKLIVDGFSGKVLVEPNEAEIKEYCNKADNFSVFQELIGSNATLPAETKDGHIVKIMANIDQTSDSVDVKSNGGEGAGLVRTEFGFITRSSTPTQDELFFDYKRLVEELAPGNVTIRTFDVGSDKKFAGYDPLDEANPALGLRSIRYCLRHQHLFRRQLRAILRASAYGNVSIMFPLITSLKEYKLARSLLDEARQELDAEGVAFDPETPVGVMIEAPAAVMIADILADDVDFFSIGTNDLIQFTLAVDRGNRHVAHLFQPLHPAIIRSIKRVADMAHEKNISVSVCGEMAGDPYSIPLLLGMPVDALSASVRTLPLVKHIVRNSSMDQCRALLDEALRARDSYDIQNLMLEYTFNYYPHDVPFFGMASGISR